MAHSKRHQDTGRSLTPYVSSAPLFNNTPLREKERQAEETLSESCAERTKLRVTGMQRAGFSVWEKKEDRREGQHCHEQGTRHTLPGKAQDKLDATLEHKQPCKENKGLCETPF